MENSALFAELTRHINSKASAVDVFDPLDIEGQMTQEFLQSIHDEVKGRIVPARVHDLLSALSVFGEPERAIPVLTLLIDRMGDTSKWVELLNLTNVASDVKSSYAHCILRGRPQWGNETSPTLDKDPLAQLIIQKGYLAHPTHEDRKGILSSLLEHGKFSENTIRSQREIDALMLALDAEHAKPGTHINDFAREAFSICPHQGHVIRLSIDRGLDLRTWAPEGSGWNPEISGRLSALQSSIEAKQAVDAVTSMTRRFSAQ